MNVDTVKDLMKLLSKINPYAKLFRHAQDILSVRPNAKLALTGIPRPGCDPKRYNQPTVDEVAMVIEGKGEFIAPGHIVLHRVNGKPIAISDLHSYYFPLRYPLLFPYGEQQWDNLYKSTTVKGKLLHQSQGGQY
jgi:hypothetical protein